MRVETLVNISRVAEMSGATVRALRHYEAEGLLEPRRQRTGVRLYTPEQCEIAAFIVRLRRCDIPLNAIRDLLAHPERADRRVVLDLLLKARRDALEVQLSLIDGLAQGLRTQVPWSG